MSEYVREIAYREGHECGECGDWIDSSTDCSCPPRPVLTEKELDAYWRSEAAPPRVRGPYRSPADVGIGYR